MTAGQEIVSETSLSGLSPTVGDQPHSLVLDRLRQLVALDQPLVVMCSVAGIVPALRRGVGAEN